MQLVLNHFNILKPAIFTSFRGLYFCLKRGSEHFDEEYNVVRTFKNNNFIGIIIVKSICLEVFPMNRRSSLCVMVLVFLFTVTNSVFASEFSLNKPSFQSADDFYKNNVDKKDYEEFSDSKLKVRKLIMVKDLPKVFDENEWRSYPYAWKKHLKKSIIGNTKGFNPEQQVYYFFSLMEDGEKVNIKFAMYDAEIGKVSSQGGGHWTKEEFKRKFKQN